MVAWLLVRLGKAVLATWGIASIVFLLSRLAADQPDEQLFDQANLLNQSATPAALAASNLALRQRLGLQEPVFYVTRSAAGWQWHGEYNQYQAWLNQLLHGNLGQSFRDGQAVTAQLKPALACTLPLMGLALGLATGLALLLAVYLAGGPPATGGRSAIYAGLAAVQSLPLFVLGLLLLLLLANPAVLNILPEADLASYQAGPGGPQELAAYAVRLVLPVAALVLSALPELTLPLAAALSHELTDTYATAAHAKGLSTSQVLWRHALPNAVLPLLVTFTGLLPALVAGSVVVEVLFALPGMGRLLADAAAAHDYPVLVAGVLVAAWARLLALLAADIVQYYLDPRLRAAGV